MHALSNHRTRTSALINLTGVFEKADESILPAMYKYISRDFDATPSQMAALTVCRGLTQALTSPLGGISGHLMNRIKVIFYGCMVWATMTWMFGLSRWAPHPLVIASIVWAFNGLGLSLVVPNVQSIIADFYSDNERGTAFGTLYFTAGVGSIIGSVYATNAAGWDVGGVKGWQFVMFTLALLSGIVGCLNLYLGKDPRTLMHGEMDEGSDKDVLKKDAWAEVSTAIKTVVRIPTFLIIILQGVVGSMPWKAIAAFSTLYLQLIGMSNLATSILMASFLVGVSFGGLLGGFLGDVASKHFPDHGRIFVCQFSVFSGIPLSTIMFTMMPKDGEDSTFWMYLFLLLFQGLLISWAAPSCNNPIFAEIVPARMRNIIYAFDRCFEDSIASPVSYLVGWAATAWFGYSGSATTSGDPEIDLPRAEALGKAIMWFSIVPFSLCLVFYSGLHFTYPKDKVSGRYSRLSETAAL
ncbi:hypothetical protein BSKO_00942 [Bryopsis sp. KO-2023]|nr:hypothetical protein BSKO_00942 [Bryopsis sp. KO-2023]